jgi:outer membrane immunogenic protein
VGFASGRWLIYGTGGLAYGEVDQNGLFAPDTSRAVFPSQSGAWSHDTTKMGWTAGAGIENVFAGNWSWKAEYL